MQYRTLGNTGVKVSALGFGCMRFPLKKGESALDIFDPTKPVDEEQVEKMIQYALDKGVNYFDTAYVYHCGKSETIVGQILKPYHDKVRIATKLPCWMVEKPDDFDRILDDQLNNLQTDYVDFYLLHGLNRPFWEQMKSLGVLEKLDEALADGRIKYAGFSFHDDVRIFKEIADAYDWSFCQIQYNYLDENYQAGKEGLLYAASKGIGVVIMEPLRGGQLTKSVPDDVQVIWDGAEEKRTPAEWGLRWVWNHRQVSVVLSGMSTFDQVKENIEIAERSQPDSLTEDDLMRIEQVTETYKKMMKIDCTSCAYCMPCPNGVNIPLNFSVYNDTFMFEDNQISYALYNQMMSPEQRASGCQVCGECEEHCPQQLSIMEELKNVHDRLNQSD